MTDIKKFFSQDSVLVGLVAGLGTEIGFAILLTIGLMVAGEPPMEHIRWYGGMFVCLLLVLQRYVKRRMLHVTKTLIIILFVTFLVYIVYIIKSGALVLQ